MSWQEKSQGVILYFCINEPCNVITFRNPEWGTCPKCHMAGSMVRPPVPDRIGIPERPRF